MSAMYYSSFWGCFVMGEFLGYSVDDIAGSASPQFKELKTTKTMLGWWVETKKHSLLF